MNTSEIQKVIQKSCVLKGHPIVCPNISISSGYWECDVLSVTTSNVVYEYEVKVSRSDFMADKKKKKKHEHYANVENPNKEWLPKACTIPHYMIYVVNDSMVLANEVPEFAGLWYIAESGNIFEVKPPKRLHKNPIDIKPIEKRVLRMYIERDALGCTRLTYENRLIKQRRDKYEAKRKEDLEKFLAFAKDLKNKH